MNKIFNQNDITHIENINSEIKAFLKNRSASQICLITDENCINLCYPVIKKALPENTHIFTIKAEEQYKTIETVNKIWDFLIDKQADRNLLIINLGGGIVTDIGGFAASTFKRGVSFINIPTTLLAQIDASAGGKTGINFKDLKNQIGTFSLPEKVFIFPDFLKTLDNEEMLSGFGEMIKHALIYDKTHYYELIDFIKNDFRKKNYKNFHFLIEKSVNIKIHFVKNDIKETGIRKALNFGHTFGHAIETYFFNKKQNIKHGIAVIYGIICELWLSEEYYNFDKILFREISRDLLKIYGKIIIPEKDFILIFNTMKHDKKNTEKNIQTVLLEDVGKPVYQTIINRDDVYKSLEKLNLLSKEM